jgi:hypothetical protein
MPMPMGRAVLKVMVTSAAMIILKVMAMKKPLVRKLPMRIVSQMAMPKVREKETLRARRRRWEW